MREKGFRMVVIMVLKVLLKFYLHPNFSRIKFGMGSEFSKGRQSDYVLGNWSDEEKEFLQEKIDFVVKMIQSFSTIGVSRTMNDFNRR